LLEGCVVGSVLFGDCCGVVEASPFKSCESMEHVRKCGSGRAAPISKRGRGNNLYGGSSVVQHGWAIRGS
jgi:hypothetical protein